MDHSSGLLSSCRAKGINGLGNQIIMGKHRALGGLIGAGDLDQAHQFLHREHIARLDGPLHHLPILNRLGGSAFRSFKIPTLHASKPLWILEIKKLQATEEVISLADRAVFSHCHRTRHGLQVMGDGGPITIDPEQGAVTVAKDGTISQGNNLLGRLQLFNFEDPQGLTRVEGGYFEAPEGAAPEAVEDGQVVQGAIESSNVLPMEELVSLIQVARAYEASQRSMLSHDDLISKAINSLGSTTA